MTIYTGKLLEKDPEKQELKLPEPVVVHGPSPEHENLANHKDEARPPILLTVMSRQRRRRGACANACLLLTAMVVLATGILGGIYLYKSLSRRTFEGWCGVTYFEQEELDEMRRQSELRQTAGAVYKERARHILSRGKFEEHIEIDKIEGKYERIEVPEFEMSSPATVIHDFEKNLTAIVDSAHLKCFLLPLNRTIIVPPQSHWDLLGKLISGYYMPDLEVVRERYSVVQPKILPTIRSQGYYIVRQCNQLDTYMLKKIGKNEPVAMVKRDVRAVSGNQCQFAVPGGLHQLPVMQIEGC